MKTNDDFWAKVRETFSKAGDVMSVKVLLVDRYVTVARSAGAYTIIG